MTRRTMAAVVLVLMLSGCGDGDGGKQPSSNASSGAATGAPTPAPTPTPTPTPAPAARSYTYEKAADLTRDRTFTGYDRFSSTSKDGKFTIAQFQSSESAVTNWVKIDSKITFADSSDLPDGGVFSYPNFSVGTGLSIDLNGRLVALGLPSGMPDYQYFMFSEYRDSSIHRLFVIGSPTDPAELNKSVTLTYLAMIGEEFNSAGVKATTVMVDLAKSVVTGTVPLLLSKDHPTNVTLTGTIDATRHMAGTLQSADGKLTGEFRGRAFGPGGKELALVVAAKQADGTLAWTRLTGTLQQ